MGVRILSAQEMRAVDRWAIDRMGIPALRLMENAGAAVASCVEDWCIDAASVLVLVGKGNNGGDGLVAARHLRSTGRKVVAWLLFPESELSPEAKVNLESAREAGVVLAGANDSPEAPLASLDRALSEVDVVLDGMLGTGAQGAPRGVVGAAIGLLNASDVPVVAIDGPSGVDGDRGAVEGSAVLATHTVALGSLKMGLVLYPGAGHTGDVRVVDIGIPGEATNAAAESNRSWIGSDDVIDWLPARRPDAHKGEVGKVLVLAGSPGMTGAACLAAETALRTGAGYVVLGAPRGLLDLLSAKLTEVVLVPLPESADGTLNAEAVGPALEWAARADAVALGPGISRTRSTLEFVEGFLAARSEQPMVIDADGLHAVATLADAGPRLSPVDVVTPHAGEMARLLGVERDVVDADRLASLDTIRDRIPAVTLLKGSPTLVSSPDGSLRVISTGNSGMATAGMGDVLTGVVAAYLAAGLTPVDAASAAAYVHGVAGDRAAGRLGVGLLARDVRDELPGATLDILGHESPPDTQ